MNLDKARHIYSNRSWVEGKLQPATISIAAGKIVGITLAKQPDALDAGESIIMPGVIDAHVHVNEPGRTEWEGFDSCTQSAAAGGITSIIDMPLNASPVTTTVAAFTKKLDASLGKLNINAGFYGGLIPGNIDSLEELMNAGVLGIKCFLTHSGIDEFPNVGRAELEAAMPLIRVAGIPLLAHCELYDGDASQASPPDPKSYLQYVASRPKSWENKAVDLMIELCRLYNCKTHIVHVSSAEALPAIAAAKLSGIPLTAETCPHYLYFNSEDIADGQTIFKCAPPIRDGDNNLLLKKALLSGTLDFLGSDHSPAPASLKESDSGDLSKAWGGIAGIQFLLSASYTALKDQITLEKFIPLLTSHPAHFLKIDDRKGFLKEGFDADIVIWSPEQKFTIFPEDILHRHKISPYTGQELYGVVNETVVNGISVYRDKKIINKNAGQWILRK